MGVYHDKLLDDIHDYLVEFGPCTASSVADGLKDQYKDRLLTYRQIAQYSRQLVGQGRARHMDSGLWEAVV